MSRLSAPNAAYAGDHGDPDPEIRELLAAAQTGGEAYLRAVAGLCRSRLLLPIVALGDDSGGAPNPDRHAELHAVQLTTADGRTGLPVFTGVDALNGWQPGARPVPCRLDEVAAEAAGQGSAALLIDIAGPYPLVIEGELLAELARARRLVELPEGGWGWLYVAADSSPAGAAG